MTITDSGAVTISNAALTNNGDGAMFGNGLLVKGLTSLALSDLTLAGDADHGAVLNAVGTLTLTGTTGNTADTFDLTPTTITHIRADTVQDVIQYGTVTTLNIIGRVACSN